MKPGTSLEKDVQRVYSSLLNMRDEGVLVANSVFMTGKSGVQHEIDVYYEFMRAGIRHRVAIECKDWAKPVSKGQIQEFESKLRDIGNITGVVISRNGYQSGADAFARHWDIMPLLFSDLPAFNVLLAERLKTVALPTEDYVGEPFWIIMELRDGKETGSHFATTDDASVNKVIPLALSKAHAERIFHEAGLSPDKWAVRGLPRYAFRAFLIQLELYEKLMNAGAAICFLPPGSQPDDKFIAFRATREDLIRDYYGEDIPSIEEGMKTSPRATMPSCQK